VVSEISNLAIALEALSLKPRESQPPALRQERGGGEVSLPPPPSEAASAGNQGHSTFGLGATAAAPAGITGYASLPITATDTHRQAASYRRR
jgi:hypothetical protein